MCTALALVRGAINFHLSSSRRCEISEVRESFFGYLLELAPPRQRAQRTEEKKEVTWYYQRYVLELRVAFAVTI